MNELFVTFKRNAEMDSETCEHSSLITTDGQRSGFLNGNDSVHVKSVTCNGEQPFMVKLTMPLFEVVTPNLAKDVTVQVQICRN